MVELKSLFNAVRGIASAQEVKSLFIALRETIRGTPAYAHPNGFLVYDIYKESNVDLRLHVWEGSVVAQPFHEIHDHVYDVRSVILTGCLLQKTWDERSSRYGSFKEYSVTYRDGTSSLEPTGRKIEASVAAQEHLRAPLRYELDAGRLHSVEPLVFPSATLFLRDLHEGAGNPRVLGTADAIACPPAERQQVEEAVTLSGLEAVFSSID
ncbi:hypothetical protein [Parasphingorhabdus sp.]|uniref:hypothetical protein n=1 Tax=Parasphingorhabdus sp. TaxID=2709688 RepID=UPI002F942D5C